jgi:hypothetical protein
MWGPLRSLAAVGGLTLGQCGPGPLPPQPPPSSPTEKVFTTLEMSPAEARIFMGNSPSLVLGVVAYDQTHAPMAGTGQPSFASSNPGAIIVDASGVATALGAGITTITATLTVGGITRSATSHLAAEAATLLDPSGANLHVPLGIRPLRGVLVYLLGTTVDMRPFVRGELAFYSNLALLRNTDLAAIRSALLEFTHAQGMALLGASSSEWASENVAAALMEVSATNLPELAQAPLLIVGASGGGCAASQLASRFPERMIGFIATKPSCMADELGAARSVPGYIIIARQDPSYSEAHQQFVTETVARHRADGAIWAFGIEPVSTHEPFANTGLLLHWMSTVAERRLPAAGAPGGLSVVAETSGWLGSRCTLAIAPHGSFSEPGPTSWFPSEGTARDWAGMMLASGVRAC